MRVRVLALLLLAACASSATDDPASGAARTTVTANRELEDRADFLQRLQERLAAPDGDDAAATMNSLEHLLPSWQTEQRRQREKPLENIITIKVVTHFDDVMASFRGGPRARRLVAAWALGFAQVPPNDLGIASPQAAARDALAGELDSTDDELMRNVLLGLWKLGDPQTPLQPIVDIMVQHHDPDVRANAALVLTTILTVETAPRAQDGLLVALADNEPKVRMHAAVVVTKFPAPACTERLLQLLAVERTPLVRAAMAAALGAAGSRAAAPMLLTMLASSREIESISAREALAQIYGEDRGREPGAWSDLVPQAAELPQP